MASLVHEILGIRTPFGKRGRGSDSQDLMDQSQVYFGWVNERLSSRVRTSFEITAPELF